MRNIILCSAFVSVIAVCAARGSNPEKQLVAHEWGTFTSLQDEQGKAVGGINTDDEPVPNFVHRISVHILAPQARTATLPNINLIAGKGMPISRCDEEITMRLETPVIYFYPPKGWKAQAVDVHVAFPGGWLSEFYPDAAPKTPGFDPQKQVVGHLRRDTTGELAWTGLEVGGPGATAAANREPVTQEKVWLAPRAVDSAVVSTPQGESEKFLFYRGVANADAPLRITRNDGGCLEVRNNECMQASSPDGDLPIHAAWLVDVRSDGACAFKEVGAIAPGAGVRATMPGGFDAKDYSPDNMAGLRAQMKTALVKEGLFADEADALLNTWEVSYFQNPGLRFFYTCPRQQIDAALPLTISAQCSVTRVMLGRIEVVTPGQRALLKEIATAMATGITADGLKKQNQDYIDLGRFRNALVLDEEQRRPSAGLEAFINRNNLGAYKIEDPAPAQAGLFGVALLAAAGVAAIGKIGKRVAMKQG
ncbi:MAG TPA: hypothetical protein VG733_13040 [Chthoniobacteraceae bacterium]|nr:hypothetical protein [Chthoniobacteraceae bacterium]